MEANEQSIKIKHLEKLIEDQNDIISAHKIKVKDIQEDIWRTEIEMQVKGEFYSPLEGMEETRVIFNKLDAQLISLKAELTVLESKSHVFNLSVIAKLKEKINSLSPKKLHQALRESPEQL
jgi:hypothetical protein